MENKAEFQNLIAQGKTEEALLLFPEDRDIIMLRARFENGKKQFHKGLIDFNEWQRIINQINFALLELKDNFKGRGETPATKGHVSSGSAPKVYVIFDHQDYEVVLRIKSVLEKNKIQVVIDLEKLELGADIRKYIDEQIKHSDFILLTTSKHSLKSGWIARGINNAINNGSKLIPILLDDSLFDSEFLFEVVKEIDVGISENQKKITLRKEFSLSFDDLQENERQLNDLRLSLPRTIDHLKKIYSVKISKEDFEEGMKKVMATIQSYKRERSVGIGPKNEEALPNISHEKESSPVIYFSYASDEGRKVNEEDILDKLFSSLQREGFSVRKDAMDIGYRDLISEFIKEIGKGDLIIVALSDKYFRSTYCMFELYEIWRNSKLDKQEFVKKIFPLHMEKIRLDDPKVLKSYLIYWEEKEKNWHNLIQRRASHLSEEQFATYEKVKQIYRFFATVASFVQDMNAKSVSYLSQNDFKEIIKEIKDAIEKGRKA